MRSHPRFSLRLLGWSYAVAVLALSSHGCGDDDDAGAVEDDSAQATDTEDAGTAMEDSGAVDDATHGDAESDQADPMAGDGGDPPDASASGDASPDGEAEQGDAESANTDASEPDRRVNIQFKAKVGSDDFACGEVYSGLGTSQAAITPMDFRMYVQDLRLVTADGEERPVQMDESAFQGEGVALLDFEETKGQCVDGDSKTNAEITGMVPAGDYTGIVFRNGVPKALNHLDLTGATTAAPPPPLKSPNIQWSWLTGFRFIKVEVKQVADPAAQGLEDGGVAEDAGTVFLSGTGMAHPGSTGCTGNPRQGTVVCNKENRNEVRLADFDPDSSVIVVDLAAIFANTDLSEDTQCHATSEQACAPIFEQLGIDYETGQALPEQQVYRVE